MATEEDVNLVTDFLIEKIDKEEGMPKREKKIAKRAVMIGRDVVLALLSLRKS